MIPQIILAKLTGRKSQLLAAIKDPLHGTSQVVRCLRICASTAEDMGSVSVWESKIYHAFWHGQKIFFEKKL